MNRTHFTLGTRGPQRVNFTILRAVFGGKS